MSTMTEHGIKSRARVTDDPASILNSPHERESLKGKRRFSLETCTTISKYIFEPERGTGQSKLGAVMCYKGFC